MDIKSLLNSCEPASPPSVPTIPTKASEISAAFIDRSKLPNEWQSKHRCTFKKDCTNGGPQHRVISRMFLRRLNCFPDAIWPCLCDKHYTQFQRKYQGGTLWKTWKLMLLMDQLQRMELWSKDQNTAITCWQVYQGDCLRFCKDSGLDILEYCNHLLNKPETSDGIQFHPVFVQIPSSGLNTEGASSISTASTDLAVAPESLNSTVVIDTDTSILPNELQSVHRCSFDDNCNSRDQRCRAIISWFFSRNKYGLPELMWPYLCDKHYARLYNRHRDEWDAFRLELVKDQVRRMDLWSKLNVTKDYVIVSWLFYRTDRPGLQSADYSSLEIIEIVDGLLAEIKTKVDLKLRNIRFIPVFSRRQDASQNGRTANQTTASIEALIPSGQRLELSCIGN